ncbi:ABC transporter permease [Paenibacillus roseipurpureus]|uniref:ABC transporter permease subunit n=1 Tax=Paenibacillus roseopurpureus TaxID=2918901 RepID=A0AA96LQG0_9BACL|nr:ABC transporter permease subunit [Paenibacillus sp. MBLB1832]WNR45406.1 ABC transporter permease subunit [Paenibacillus sp. MBLB1832]
MDKAVIRPQTMGSKAAKKNWFAREWKHFKKNSELFLLALPGVLHKLIFLYLPMFGLVLAFKRFRFDKGIWGSDWIGFKNFEFFLTSDNAFRVTRNTILYNCGFILITTVSALTLAVLLNEVGKRWVKVYQTALFLPYFLSWVVVSYITLGFLDHSNGYLNHILALFGTEPVKWYEAAKAWPTIIVVVNLWKGIGFATLVYYAGIIGIDQEYYEAAKMDGASRIRMVTGITIPLLMPLIIILLIISIGGIFRADFGLFYFIPNDSSFLYPVTDVIDTYVYRSLKVVGDIGMSTAVGLYQSVVGFIFVLTANVIVKKFNSENSLW